MGKKSPLQYELNSIPKMNNFSNKDIKKEVYARPAQKWAEQVDL